MKKGVLSCLLIFPALLGFSIVTSAVERDSIDRAAGAWYAEAVAYCQNEGIMSSTSEVRFAPQDIMSRAMMATVLWNMDGKAVAAEAAPFSDVPSGMWYTDAIRWAADKNIITGYNSTTFDTNGLVTREQIAAILYGYEQYKNNIPAPSGNLTFNDTNNISPWAREAVLWAYERGIITGKQGNIFDPKAGATCAEVAVMLHRYLTADKQQKTEEPSVDENGMLSVDITVGEQVFAAQFMDNETSRAIISQMPLTIDMSDFNGQEKVATLLERHLLRKQSSLQRFIAEKFIYGQVIVWFCFIVHLLIPMVVIYDWEQLRIQQVWKPHLVQVMLQSN